MRSSEPRAYMSSKQAWKKCTFCNSGRKPCLTCGGSGKTMPGWQKCNFCNGFGSTICTGCGGSGGKWETIWVPE